MQQPLRILLTVVLVILALLAGNWVWNYYLYAPWTRDGKVRAEIITLSPDVSGWVRELPIRDDQTRETHCSVSMISATGPPWRGRKPSCFTSRNPCAWPSTSTNGASSCTPATASALKSWIVRVLRPS